MPEETTVQDIKSLMSELTGNPGFARRRGTLGSMIQLLRRLSHADSPSSAKRDWEELVSDLNPIVYRLAKLRRDGKKNAVEELLRALEDPHFLFTGENVSIDRSTKVTLVIPEAVRTIDMFRRLETQCLNNDDLRYIHLPEGTPRKRLPFIHSNMPSVISRSGKRFETAYCVDGQQGQVLSALGNRDHQARFATWQLCVPTHLWQHTCPHRGSNRYRVELMFVSEDEHEALQRAEPAFTSRGVCHGLGVMISIRNMDDPLTPSTRGRPLVTPQSPVFTLVNYGANDFQ